jgi:hypothetical protein
MPDSFTQVPPNSTGNKMRTRSRVIGADTVHEQAVFQGALPTYYALVDAAAFAANKHHLSILNASGGTKIIAIKKISMINVQLSSVTGVAARFDVKRITAHSGGTIITPSSCDSLNPSLPAEITVRTGATSVTESTLLFPLVTTTDEVTAANTAVANFLSAGLNWALEGPETQETRLRPGEGLTIKQITSTTVGSYSWLMAFTVDDV